MCFAKRCGMVLADSDTCSITHVLYYSDGFQRITTGNERGSYFHPLFLRHRLFLCERMMRYRIKGTGTKGAVNPENEPDFNTMPPIKPLDQTPLNKPTGETTTWKVTYTQSLKKHRQEKEKTPKPPLKHRRVCMREEPMTTTVQSFEPPVVPSKVPTAEHFITEKANIIHGIQRGERRGNRLVLVPAAKLPKDSAARHARRTDIMLRDSHPSADSRAPSTSTWNARWLALVRHVSIGRANLVWRQDVSLLGCLFFRLSYRGQREWSIVAGIQPQWYGWLICWLVVIAMSLIERILHREKRSWFNTTAVSNKGRPSKRITHFLVFLLSDAKRHPMYGLGVYYNKYITRY